MPKKQNITVGSLKDLIFNADALGNEIAGFAESVREGRIDGEIADPIEMATSANHLARAAQDLVSALLFHYRREKQLREIEALRKNVA